MELLRISSALLAAAIGLGPLVPPEHVHETEEDGHHRLLVHRHAEAHPLAAAGAPSRGRELHEDDEPVLTLRAVFTVPDSPAVPQPSPASVVVLSEPPLTAVLHRAGDSREPLIHGPPRASASLRAPPLSTRL